MPLRPSIAFFRMKDAYIKMAVHHPEELLVPIAHRLAAEVRVALLVEHPIPNS